MSKIIAFNNEQLFDEIHDIQIKSGFARHSIDNFGKMKICAYKKLNVDNDNYVKFDDGFVMCSGTLIYKNRIGKGSIVELHDDFKTAGIMVKNDCRGFYCVCICIKQELHFFVGGGYSLYYYNCHDDLLVSTLFYYIVKAKKCKVNYLGFQERCIHYCNNDRETPFKNVYRLRENEEIIISNDKMTLINRIQEPLKHSEGTLDNLVYELKKNSLMLASCFSKTALFSTGGFDSRLALATMLAANMKPTLLSWKGNLYTALANPNDRIVSEQLAEKYDLPIERIQFSDDFELKDTGELCSTIWRFGEIGKLYSSNRAYFTALSKMGDTYITAGYFGEIYRNNECLDAAYKKPFTTQKYVNDFYLNQKFERAFANGEELRQYIANSIASGANDLLLDPSNLSKEDCMKIHYWFYRLHADTYTCQLINMYTYSSSILAPIDVVDIILSMPYEKLGRTRMEIACAKKLREDIFEVPIFSHQAYYRIKNTDHSAKRIVDKGTRVKGVIKKVLGDEIYYGLKRLLKKDILNNDELTFKEMYYYEKCIEEFEEKVNFKMTYDKNELFVLGRMEIAINYYYLLAYMIF